MPTETRKTIKITVPIDILTKKLNRLYEQAPGKCFGYYGNPSSILNHNNECSKCTLTVQCEQRLKQRIEKTVKVVKQTKLRGTVDFDLFKIGYVMKPTTPDKLHSLYLRYADSKSSYIMGCKTNGCFYNMPISNFEVFVKELKETLTNLDNLEAYKREW